MIVPAMTVQDIHKEVMEDLKSMSNKLKFYKREFERIILKSARFPKSKTYRYQTFEKKNTFFITFTALKRNDWNQPIINIYTIYNKPEGKYAVVPSIETNQSSIYPPHFFKRYRERILKNENINADEIISNYFNSDWGFLLAVINDKYESVFYAFENMEDEKVSFVAATSVGYCFGEKQGNSNILKTIISEEMLFENQVDVFTSLKEQFVKINDDKYIRRLKN